MSGKHDSVQGDIAHSQISQTQTASRHWVILVLAPLLIYLGCAKAGAQNTSKSQLSGENGPANQSGQSLILERKTIQDPGTGNIKSHHLLIPRGWKLEGKTQWAAMKYYRILPSPVLKISNTQGLEARVSATMAYSDPRPHPSLGFPRPREDSSDAGYPVKYFPESNSSWKREVKNRLIAQQRPQAKQISVDRITRIPEMTQVLKQIYKPTLDWIKAQRQQGVILGAKSNVSLMSIAFESSYIENGIEKEELRILGIVKQVSILPGVTKVNWILWPNVAYSAPKGQLEENLPLLMTITSSVRPTPEWSDKLFDHVCKMRQIDRQAFEEQNRLFRKAFSEINQIQKRSDANYNRVREETHRKVINSIRGTSDYAYQGNEYQLPVGYDHVYTDGIDSIILTNDALFDPNVELGTSTWGKMKLVR